MAMAKAQARERAVLSREPSVKRTMETADGRAAVGVVACTIFTLVSVAALSAVGILTPDGSSPHLATLENIAALVFGVFAISASMVLITNIPRGVDQYPAISLLVSAAFLGASAMALTGAWLGDCHCWAKVIVHTLAAIDALLMFIGLWVGRFRRPEAVLQATAELALRQLDHNPTIPDATRLELITAARRLRAIADRRGGMGV